MRCFPLVAVFVPLIGCTVPAERVPLQPLPENGQVLPYTQLVARLHSQVMAANDASYLEHWDDLQDLAKGMQQTMRFLSKAEDAPASVKDSLKEKAGDLGKMAEKLRQAAAAKDAKAADEAMARIMRKERPLR